MTRNDFLKKYNLTENQFLGTEIISDSLDLHGLMAVPDVLTAFPDGFSPTVGSVDLHGLTSIPGSFSPTVGRTAGF